MCDNVIAVNARPWTVLSVCGCVYKQQPSDSCCVWQLGSWPIKHLHAHMLQPLCQQTSYSSTETALRSDFICTWNIIQNPLRPPRKYHRHLRSPWLSVPWLSLIYGPVLAVVTSPFAVHYSIISIKDPSTHTHTHTYSHCNLSSDHCEQSNPFLPYAA